MVLKGDAKREYQRIYMREYMRKRRQKDHEDLIVARLDYAKAKARTDGLRSFYAEREADRQFNEEAALMVLGPVTDDAEGYDKLLTVAKHRGYSRAWAAHRFRERFGHWPPRIAK
jgi:hypothetical protein